MNSILRMCVVILAVVVVLAIGKDLIVKASIEAGVRAVTGLKLSMGSFRVGIISTIVDIGNLKLYNPAGFYDKVMVDMPKIYVDYDLPAIFKGLVHVETIKIDLKEFIVVKNMDGVLNLDSLKVVKAGKDGTRPAAKEGGEMPAMQIDVFELKVNKVIYKDYSKGGKPVVKEFIINIDERYENVADPYSLVSLIVARVMTNSAIADLIGFDVRGLEGTVTGALSSAEKTAGQAAAEAQKTAVKAFKSIGDVTGKAGESVNKAAGALKDVFSLPFGEKKE